MGIGIIQEVVDSIVEAVERPPVGDIDVMFNIVDDLQYKWTLNSSAEARRRAPRIQISLLQMELGQINQLIRFVGAQAGETAGNMGGVLERAAGGAPYKNMYDVQAIGALIIPYFGDTHHQNNSQWEPANISGAAGVTEGMQGISRAIGTGARLVTGVLGSTLYAGHKTELPHVWKDTNLSDINVGFKLYNVDAESYKAHKTFIDSIVHYSLPTKHLLTMVTPPALAEYEIPGVRYSPIATFNVEVDMEGQKVLESGQVVPDAYNITINMKDLLMQTKNIHGLSGPNNTIKVYNA